MRKLGSVPIFMKYWLMKTEPDECSIDDALAAPRHTTPWTGVRNYQARNFMRDQMRVGDGVLFYHSSCEEPGIAGLAEVASADRKSTRLNSSHSQISYAVFCLKKKKKEHVC